jgi:SAM-dependent methyltransferase
MDRYLSDDYLKHNPTWDQEDSPWKARLVAEILGRNRISPTSICDVGCGAGLVLSELRRLNSQVDLFGFDIAPALPEFWRQHEGQSIHFQLGDFAEVNRKRYSVVLLLDVIEHVVDPFTFLSRLRPAADYFVFIIPLDLSAFTVVRERPLLRQRREVGHIHSFTKNLALSLLAESGYSVIDARYTGAAFHAPRRTWKTRVAGLPRRLVRIPSADLGVRLLGGETLLVLAQAKDR